MKSNQYIKGYPLQQSTDIDIQDTFSSAIVAIQNNSSSNVEVFINDGEPIILGASPFLWEPYIPLLGKIRTESADIVVFA